MSMYCNFVVLCMSVNGATYDTVVKHVINTMSVGVVR